MADALTVQEVERYARRLRGELTAVQLPASLHPSVRRRLDEALAIVDELLLVCEFVYAVDDGLVVVVEKPDRPAA